MAKKIFFFQIFVVLILILVSLCTTPLIIKYFPSDSDRLCNINHWSADSTIRKDYVFFGASGAMNGIAGDTISALYNVNVVSFTSVNQTLSEAFLFYSRIGKETKAVIQCIRYYDLASSPSIDPYKINRLTVDGYKIDSETSAFIDNTTRLAFNKSYLEACFGVRSFAKTSLHKLFKELIEPGRQRKESISDIRNAYLYNYERAPENAYNKYLQVMSQKQIETMPLHQEKVEMINLATEYFRTRGIEYYIVLLPVSIYTAKYLPLDYVEALKNSNLSCKIIDCSFLLDDNCFADPHHPNRKGASILSRYIMDAIIYDFSDRFLTQ